MYLYTDIIQPTNFGNQLVNILDCFTLDNGGNKGIHNTLCKPLTPKRGAKGKFHYPIAGLFSASLKMKIKIFFLLEIVRNDVNKHKMQLFPFRFHLT